MDYEEIEIVLHEMQRTRKRAKRLISDSDLPLWQITVADQPLLFANSVISPLTALLTSCILVMIVRKQRRVHAAVLLKPGGPGLL
jgi:hypothetical protein